MKLYELLPIYESGEAKVDNIEWKHVNNKTVGIFTVAS